MKEDKMVFSVIFLVLPFCLISAGLSDLFSTMIPNRISVVLLGSFLLIAPFVGLGYEEIALHVLVGLLVFIACFFFFSLNIMGGGDAKLLTTTSLWFGWNISLLYFLFYVSIFGGILALVVLLIRGITRYIPLLDKFVPRSFHMKNKIPYGVAISIGGLVSYPDSHLFKIALEGISTSF
ncbi:peptidase [Candidatus Liberibacter solanacearum]|nr:peptidase [Candidatus Liberibacter solanacearum]